MTSHPSTDPGSELRELVLAGRFREAIDLHGRLADDLVARRPDIQLAAATAATRLGDLVLAEELAREALGRFRGRGDIDGSTRALNLLGAIHWEHGRMEAAAWSFGEALQYARQLDDSTMLARACNNLASVAHLQGRQDEAAALYRTALLSYQRIGDRRGTAETYHNLGIVYREAEEWRDAREAAAAALRHAEVVGERGLLALTVTGRAEVSAGENHLAVAERELERALRLAADAGDEIGRAEVLRVVAQVALRRGEFERALMTAETAREIALTFDSALLVAECSAASALALRRLGRIADARTRRQEAEDRFRKLGAPLPLERFKREWKESGEGRIEK